MNNLKQSAEPLSLRRSRSRVFFQFWKLSALAVLAIGSAYFLGMYQAQALDQNVLKTAAQQKERVASAPTANRTSRGGMTRDAAAEEAVLQAMHKLHSAFDAGDIDAINKFIAEDDFLFVYELDPNGEPLKLSSKTELAKWLKTTFKDFKKQNAITQARNPVMTARGDSNFVMVTEECQLKILLPGNQVRIEKLRATAVARRGTDGWKFIHWHMSPAAPIKVVDATAAASMR